MLLASLLGETPVESILILKEEWLFCIVLIGIYLLGNERYRRRLFFLFCIGVAIFSAYGIVQFFTGVHWLKTALPEPGPEYGYIVRGTFPSPMTFGNYFGISGALFAGYVIGGWSQLDNRARIFYGITALMAIIATLGSYNRGAILGLIVSGVVMCGWLRRWKVLTTVIIVAVLGITTVIVIPQVRARIDSNLRSEYDPEDQTGRFYLWGLAIDIIKSNPIVGVGQGNFRHEYTRRLPDGTPTRLIRVHAHNDFMNIAAISGIPGSLFFAGIWLALFYYIRKSRSTAEAADRSRLALLSAALAGSVVFLTTSMTEATFADEEVRQMLMFIWALGLFSLSPRSESARGTPGPVEGKTS